jgi:hypothetical protein
VACATFVRTPNELKTDMKRAASTPFFVMNAAMASGLSNRWCSRCTALNTFCCIVSTRPIASSAKYIGWKLAAFCRKCTGERWKWMLAGLVLSQFSSVGSNSKQCGHAKLKNSTTSTVPAGGVTGTGLPRTWYC